MTSLRNALNRCHSNGFNQAHHECHTKNHTCATKCKIHTILLLLRHRTPESLATDKQFHPVDESKKKKNTDTNWKSNEKYRSRTCTWNKWFLFCLSSSLCLCALFYSFILCKSIKKYLHGVDNILEWSKKLAKIQLEHGQQRRQITTTSCASGFVGTALVRVYLPHIFSFAFKWMVC